MKHQSRIHFALFVVLVVSVAMFLFETEYMYLKVKHHGLSHRIANTCICKGMFEAGKVQSVQSERMSIPRTDHSSMSIQKQFHNAFECLNTTLCGKSRDSNACVRKQSSTDRFECNHFMKFEFDRGRLGNKLFQVSTLIGTAIYHGYTPIFDPSFPLTKLFDLPNVLNIELDNIRIFTKSDARYFDEETTRLDHACNWTLKGYMFSWRYFKGAEADVRKALKIKQLFVTQVKGFIKDTVPETVTTVGVHVRRGDFLKPNFQERGYIVAPIRYLKDAMEMFRKNYTRVHFFVLSDDKKWCRENMKGNNITISPFKTVELDFTLMTFCDHVIFTGGTFGWWGAWLAGGEVIYWTGYPRNGSALDKVTNRYDLYPGEWIGLA